MLLELIIKKNSKLTKNKNKKSPQFFDKQKTRELKTKDLRSIAPKRS
ncbi:hypothetical protein HPOKI128_00410 [Helicobacter pylori oki128]|nr:hypothetical protein HPOKI128_00410 [Helicobacter pylori oki128]